MGEDDAACYEWPTVYTDTRVQAWQAFATVYCGVSPARLHV